MKINGEKGQALPLAMIAVILGALVIPPFLSYASSSIIGSRYYADALEAEYACDAGVEDAIWRLTDGGLANSLTTAGSMVSYTLNESINGLLTKVNICNAWLTIATENFNTGTWTGGTGWTDNWTHSGNADVTGSGTPYEGSYHLRLRGSDGLAQRSVDLSHQSDIHLRFYAKVNSFDWFSDDEAICQVSSDGVAWTTVETWDWEDSDNMYHYCDINLATFEMTSRFWIRFDANMDSANDYFYVDKIDIIWLIAYPVVFAWDDFESGSSNWGGGGGWTANWTHTSSTDYANVIQGTWQIPAYEGWDWFQPHYHLRLQYTGFASRPTNLTDADTPRLRFAATTRSSLENNEYAYCEVSTNNGSAWSTITRFSSSNETGSYVYYDFGLSQFPMTSTFWVRFRLTGTEQNDFFYVDKIEIVNLDMFGITAQAGDRMIKAIVQIEDGVITILSWYYV